MVAHLTEVWIVDSCTERVIMASHTPDRPSGLTTTTDRRGGASGRRPHLELCDVLIAEDTERVGRLKDVQYRRPVVGKTLREGKLDCDLLN